MRVNLRMSLFQGIKNIIYIVVSFQKYSDKLNTLLGTKGGRLHVLQNTAPKCTFTRLVSTRVAHC
jgi:hypothetical protein